MDLEAIKGGEFYRVLERAVELTATQARFEITELGVKEPQRFKPVLTIPSHEHKPQDAGLDPKVYPPIPVDWYSVRPEAFLAFIQYRAAIESAEESRKAEGFALQAQQDAAAALWWTRVGYWTATLLAFAAVILQAVEMMGAKGK